MEFLITPYPTKLIELDGSLSGKIYYDGKNEGSILYQTILEELGNKGEHLVKLLPSSDKDFSSTEEGYVLTIDENGVQVNASTPQGHFYGVITLLSLIKQFGDKIPYVKIFDKPEFAFRSGSCEAGHGMVHNQKWYKHLIYKLAMQKANHIYFSTSFMSFYFDSKISSYFKGQATFEDAKELAEYAKKYNIYIVPTCTIQGHAGEILSLENYSDMREVMEGEETAIATTGNSFCPNNKRTIDFLTDLIDKMIDAFKPDIMHLGCDEIYSCGGDKACRGQKESLGKTGIILANCIRFRDYLKSKGVKLGIWGDMIVALSGENRYDGSLEENKFKQSNEYLLDKLKDNTIIFDWWYTGESENSQQFFADNGFEVVACTSTHACMMHFASPQQQINMWKLFKGAQKRKFYGGVITDWINMFGYHCEQTLFNQSAGLSLLWKGCDDNFISGVTRDQFENAYMLSEYGQGGVYVREYLHLAGDLYGNLLKLFSPKNRGVALRKIFFYEDNPLSFTMKYSIDLQNNFDEYKTVSKRLVDLWSKITENVKDEGYLEALHLPALLHEYLVQEYEVVTRLQDTYHQAAQAQLENKEEFYSKLTECSKIISELLGKSDKLYNFVLWLENNCGNNDLSCLRIKGREEKAKKLARFFLYLRNDKRLLPTLRIISDEQLKSTINDWWSEHIFEAADQEGEFCSYDTDRGMFYETMDWEVPINK